MPDGQTGDEALMAQVVQGQSPALELLLRRRADALLTFIRRMVLDHHQSEELFQDVFLTVWTKRRSYQSPRPFKPWLYAIALNKCRAFFRSRSPAGVSLNGDAASALAAPPDGSPPERAIADETDRQVLEAVHALPPQQRVVVLLRVWDDLAYGDIATVVGCSEGTVRSHMHHGLLEVVSEVSAAHHQRGRPRQHRPGAGRLHHVLAAQ
jgi:RNA polymerase sigma-70 factor (ECF subfamily)